MSALSLITPQAAGPLPTAFEVIRDSGRPDWQTVTPTQEQERKWYYVGYELRDDYALTDPVSSLPPAAYRFWWALGLTDGKSTRPRRATWSKDERQVDSSADDVPWAAVGAGLTAGALALTLWAATRGGRP